MTADIIYKYFPDLNDNQRTMIDALLPFYKAWNQNINVISRKDIDALYLHHVLHSLSIAHFIEFVPGTRILDLGTGGGFPGIPLAILFPDCQFLLIDGKAKKIHVVNELITQLKLENVKAIHKRSEELKHIKFDFITARAVTRMEPLLNLCLPLIAKEQKNILPNGVIALKGGNLKEELDEISRMHDYEQIPINTYFEEAYFDEKFIIYLPA